jgi:hypothetical protein
MAVPSYGAKLISFCESQGLANVRRLRHVENHFHSLDWAVVDKWISVKEAELKDEAVSIARKALSNSERAERRADRSNNIAIAAIMLSAATAIIVAVIQFIGQKP